jgi:putative membrane protein
MITTKYLSYRYIMNLAGFQIIWLTAWCTFVSAVFYFLEWHWMTIPWVPVALIGTAVAFFVLKTIKHTTDFGKPEKYGEPS